MRLQSHEVKVLDDEKAKELGVVNFELARGDSTIALRVVNDFSSAVESEEGVVSVGTLIDVLYRTMRQGFPVPATHAAAWRAISQNVNNCKEAHNFSQVQASIESAEIGKYDVEFHIANPNLSIEGRTEPKTIRVAGDALTIASYRELSNRLQQYRHTLVMNDDTLEVHLYVSPETFAAANELVVAMTTEEGVFTVVIANGDKVVYAPVVPAYLVADSGALMKAIETATSTTPYPPVEFLKGNIIHVTTDRDFDALNSGVLMALMALESKYFDNGEAAVAE